jgi:hypothetical protein
MRVWQLLANADAIGFVLDVRGLGLIVLMMHHLNMREGFGTATYEKRATSKQIASGSMFFWVRVSQRKIATSN